jgi:hypothetical protein
LVLTKVDLNKTLSDDSFRLSYPAGTQVYDEVHPQAQNSPDGAVTYQVPATASELDSAVNHALDEQVSKSRAIDDSRPVNWLVVANVTAIFFAIAAAIFYKMRKGRGK